MSAATATVVTAATAAHVATDRTETRALAIGRDATVIGREASAGRTARAERPAETIIEANGVTTPIVPTAASVGRDRRSIVHQSCLRDRRQRG